jgi:hypothetical protein
MPAASDFGESQDLRDCRQLDRRMAMAQVIEFYVPARFQKKVKWIPASLRGKVIEFPMPVKKTA